MSYAPNGSELILPNGNFTREQRNGFQKTIPSSSKRFSRKLRAKNGKPLRPSINNDNAPPIIVHCHLCWDWVWQRPQQFISRLSHRHRILFVETIGPDPGLASPVARYHTPKDFPNITVLRLQFPTWQWNKGSVVDRERRRLVKNFITGAAAGQFENPIQWFYDPMAVRAFLGHMEEKLNVYDCMDELSKFRCAPPEIKNRETALLKTAEVVFTGGRRLYEAKRLFNGNCHFFGCGVEVTHFGKALESQTKIPTDLAKLRKPALGYFGVVDERMDYELIAKLADANPKWSIAIVGPVLKVDPESLPARPNLHWLGQREYADLPAYCKGFAACLMPFALNESTEFINPTKALEYMASGRQIISTAVPDVVSNFSSVVKVARSHEEFIEHCRKALAEPDTVAIERGLRMAGENTWESIVAQLQDHVAAALTKKSSTGVIA
jgi:glycosyltransferase involved in cell wall biosynthesis